MNVEGDEWEESIDRSNTLVKLADHAELDSKTIIEKIKNAGIVGLGGATFPCHVKLSPPPGCKAECVIINAVECEPYLTADHRLMLEHPEEILEGVLEHHEWYNGEGYPMRKASDEISLFGRIIKIADSYDAMVSKTPYHKPIVPSDAVEYIMAMAGVEFDPKLVIQFLDCVAVYPVGCEVVLSTGEHAIVVRNHRGFVLRPRVMLMESATTIDLKDDKDARCITIVELVA